MNRDIWGREREDIRRRADAEPGRDYERDRGDLGERRDFGQADYNENYGYDPDHRLGYRRDAAPGERDFGPADYDRTQPYDPHGRAGFRPVDGPGRTFDERPVSQDPRERRREAADRRIWAVVSERLERAKRLDASYIEVRVQDGVVFLSGTTRTRRGKRMVEDLAEVEGVVDVVNGLRLRDR